MILSSRNRNTFYSCLDEIGLKECIFNKSALIKINLARPAEVDIQGLIHNYFLM